MAIRNKALAALALTSMLGVAACGSTKDDTDNETAATPAATQEGGAASGGGEIKEGLKIAFLPKQINNPYFTISDKGGEEAVNAIKGEFKRVGPSDTAASSQVSYINTLTTQKQDAIVISANDANAVVPALEKAKAAGIKVVTYDSDTAPEGRDLFINQAAAEDLGRSQVQLLAEADRPGGRRDRHPLRHPERDEPEHLDRLHEGRALQAGVLQAQARQDRRTATTTTRSPSRRPRACCRPTRT